MNLARLLDVLVISLPVFAVMGLGKLLARRGIFTDDRIAFANSVVYHLALPALIFNEVARQRPSRFLEPALFIIPLAAMVFLGGLYAVIARRARFPRDIAAPFVFGTFWANVTYMGFPLAYNAFGANGLAHAAVYNAVLMPTYVILGYGIIIATRPGHSVGGMVRKLVLALGNPIVLAAAFGIGVACAVEPFRTPEGRIALPAVLLGLARITGSFLKLLGGMGLPLALLAIGASLKFTHIRTHRVALGGIVLAKLLLLPALVLLAIRGLRPETDPVVTGVAVLLSATPNAIASFVIASQENVAPAFVAATLAVSTLLSLISLPIWLYFLI